MTLTLDSCSVEHPIDEIEVQAMFSEKRQYLLAMQEKRKPEIEAEKATWVRGEIDIFPPQRVVRTIIEQADRTAEGINTRRPAEFRRIQPSVVLDFRRRASTRLAR